MIETTNNVLFWIGYIAGGSILLLILVLCLYLVIILSKQLPSFWNETFDIMIYRSFKNINKKQFDKWIERMKIKYEHSQKELK